MGKLAKMREFSLKERKAIYERDGQQCIFCKMGYPIEEKADSAAISSESCIIFPGQRTEKASGRTELSDAPSIMNSWTTEIRESVKRCWGYSETI